MSRLFWIAGLLLILAACGKEEPAAPPVDEPVAADEPAAVEEAPVEEAVEAADEVLEVVEESAAEPEPEEEAIILASPGESREWQVNGVKRVDYLMKPLRSLSLVRTLYPSIRTEHHARVDSMQTLAPGRELGVLLRRRRILLVDDNKTNLQVARLLLKRLGLEVDTALSGAEALESIASNIPEVVFLDLQMPEMDGFQTAREILKKLPGAYIIAMTAAATTEDRSASAAAGMRDFVSKPIKESDLSRALWTYYHQGQLA